MHSHTLFPSQAGFNVFWLDFCQYPLKATLVNDSKIDSVNKHWFREAPSDFPYPLHACVSSTQNPEDIQGHICVLSPLEFLWGPVIALADQLDCGISDEDVNAWHDAFLGVTVVVHVIDSLQERVWKAVAFRENQVEAGEISKLTPLERVSVVVEIKGLLEKNSGVELGSEQISVQWNEYVKTSARGSEPMKPALVDTCLTIERRILCNESLKEDLMMAERNGPVFTSVSQYDAAVKKGGTGVLIEWSLRMMIDYVLFQNTPAGELSVRALSGKGLPAGKGLVDLFMAKRDCGVWLVQKASMDKLIIFNISRYDSLETSVVF